MHSRALVDADRLVLSRHEKPRLEVHPCRVARVLRYSVTSLMLGRRA